MSNKIIDGLVNGNLVSTNKVVFDKSLPCYLLDYAGGKVGVFIQTGRTAYYTYNEISFENGIFKQTNRPNKDFLIDSSINSLFTAIYENNYKIANLTTEELKNITEFDQNFIKQVYWYNPKTDVKLETYDLSKWAITQEQKDKLSKANVYLSTIENNSKVKSESTALVSNLATFLVNSLAEAQKTGTTTVGGMVQLNIGSGLQTEGKILSSYNELSKLSTSIGTFGDFVNLALASATEWTLGRVVDFTITPFIYLIPKTTTKVVLLPAIAQTSQTTQTTST